MLLSLSKNFNTKESAQKAVANGRIIRVIENLQECDIPPFENGTTNVYGPIIPIPHISYGSWYGTATVKDGIVTSIT